MFTCSQCERKGRICIFQKNAAIKAEGVKIGFMAAFDLKCRAICVSLNIGTIFA